MANYIVVKYLHSLTSYHMWQRFPNCSFIITESAEQCLLVLDVDDMIVVS